MKPVRICCFCLCWSSGGIEAFLSSTLANICLDGIEIDIVAAVLEPSVFTEKLREKGVRFYSLSGKRWAVLKNGRMFRSLIKNRRYDAIHFNLYEALSLCYLVIAARLGVKTRIVHAHQAGLRKSFFRPIKAAVHRAFSAAFCRFATERFACSTQTGGFFFPKGCDFGVLPNGIEPKRFTFDENDRIIARTALGIANEPVIGTVGRLSSEKNQIFLLDILKSVQQKLPDSKLLIVGDGDELSALKQRANQLGISDSVIFFGSSDSPERLMSAMDIFVLPSLVEGFGIAAVEAQANGLVSICSENVAGEAALTPLFHRMTLADGADFWAERIAESLFTEENRRIYADLIEKTEFTAAKTAKRIEKIYRASGE